MAKAKTMVKTANGKGLRRNKTLNKGVNQRTAAQKAGDRKRRKK